MQTKPAIVGVDGSEVSTGAVRFACEGASRRSMPLLAVYAAPSIRPDFPGAAGFSRTDAEDAARLLSEGLAGLREEFPAVRVEVRVEDDAAATALTNVASGAALLLVGSHGRGAFRGMLLGSVSSAVLRALPCPVAVVRPHGHGAK